MNDEELGQETPEDDQGFGFDGGAGTVSGQDSRFTEPSPESAPKEIPQKKGGSLRLLLLLLVVAAAAAGFYLIGQDPFAPETPVALVNPQTPSKIKVPDRPAAVDRSEGVEEEVVAAEKVAMIVPKPEPAPAPAPAPAQAFALTAGSYLYRSELNRAIGQIEKMGYKVTSSQRLESHEMTRLLVGLFAKPLAVQRLAEVKKLSDGAFLVAEEGKYAVYAGSYIDLDQARRSADLLYLKGVKVEERRIKVDLPRTTLRFGGFATRGAAEKVASRLKKLRVAKLQIVPFQ